MHKALKLITLAVIFLSFISGKNIEPSFRNLPITGTWKIESVITYYGSNLIQSIKPNQQSYLQFFDNKKLHYVSFNQDGLLNKTQFNVLFSYSNNRFTTIDLPLNNNLEYLITGSFNRLSENNLKLRTYTDSELQIEYILYRTDKNLALYGI